MSIAETILIFAGIPAAIAAVVFALVYGTSGRRSSKRYRPGRPFTFTPVWFVAAAGQVAETTVTPSAVTASPPAPALEPAAAEAAREQAVPVQYGETGGASDSW